jgi:D-xylose transport system substrate-binding protein
VTSHLCTHVKPTNEVVSLDFHNRRKIALTAVAACAALVAAACGSSGSSSSSSGSSGSSGSSSVPQISAASFNLTFSAMKTIKPLAAKGKGKVAVILPDTVSSTRYVEFDAPYLKKSFQLAGLSSGDTIIQNALGSDATQFSDAQADITNGATVLVVDPLDSGVGSRIESYAKSHGVPVIDYDRLTLGGTRKYYVSFNNTRVGTLLGNGLVSCIAAWHVAKPQVIVMRGDPTDNNATLFADGYLAVLKPKFTSKAYVDVANPAGTWTPATALTEFQAAFTAHPNANAVLMPNDENGAPIIHYLQTKGIKAKTFPVTGQDATLTGLQNVIAGYQCGTVYKPIYLEAQAAAALAMYLRAGVTPPKELVNGLATDVNTHTQVPSILETPEWVVPTTIQSTVIKDGFVTAAQLCTGSYKADCTKYGIGG